MKRYIIDRIEEGRFAVCEEESGSQAVFELGQIRGEVREGDCLKEENGVLQVDAEATRLRREKLRKFQQDLFED